MESTNSTKTAEISFVKDSVIEIPFASIKEGKEGQLFNEYFPQVMPILKNLGGRSLGAFKVVNADHASAKPQMITMFEWPNQESYHQLHQNETLKKIVHPISISNLQEV